MFTNVQLEAKTCLKAQTRPVVMPRVRSRCRCRLQARSLQVIICLTGTNSMNRHSPTSCVWGATLSSWCIYSPTEAFVTVKWDFIGHHGCWFILTVCRLSEVKGLSGFTDHMSLKCPQSNRDTWKRLQSFSIFRGNRSVPAAPTVSALQNVADSHRKH